MLLDRSLLIRKKLVENTKIEKLKCEFLTFERFSNTVKHAKSTRGFVTYSVHICDKCHPRITWFEATTWSPLWSVSITTLTAAIPTKSSKKWWENWKTWLRVVKQCGTSKQKFSFTFSDHYCWWGCRFAFVTFPSPLLSWVPFLS